MDHGTREGNLTSFEGVGIIAESNMDQGTSRSDGSDPLRVPPALMPAG